jgi:hypothetical protein
MRLMLEDVENEICITKNNISAIKRNRWSTIPQISTK